MQLNKLLAQAGMPTIGATAHIPTVEINEDELFAVERELAAVESELKDIELSNAIVAARHDNICDLHTVFMASDRTTEVGRKSAALNFAVGMSQNGFDHGFAEETQGSCESETQGVIESFSAVKRSIETIFKYAAEQWEKFRAFISKYWNKYFSLLAFTKRNWNRIMERAKQYRDDNYALDKEKKDKIEISSAADNFVIGKAAGLKAENTPMSASDLLEDTRLWKEILTMWEAAWKDFSLTPLDGPETIVGQTFTAPNFDDFKALGNATHNRGDSADNSYTAAKYLAGRYVCGLNVPTYPSGAMATADDIREVNDAVRTCTMEILGTNVGNKALDSIKLDTLDLVTIEKVAELNIELVDALLSIKSSKALRKIDTDLTKASKGYAKWVKAADVEDSAEVERVKVAATLANSYNDMMKRVSVTFLQGFSAKARSVSESKATWCSRSLSYYKKVD